MNLNKQHAAVCGLFCPGCTFFIGTSEDPKRLKRLAGLFETPVEDMKCLGCRSNTRIAYCDSCKLYLCAQKKGIDFCGECAEFPCNELKDFQAGGAHRFELWNSHSQIIKKGYKKWMLEMIKIYSCPACGTINSAYDDKCRKCGHTPSNQYTEKYRQKILDFQKKHQTRLKLE
ncbi:MAG: DUF3795 domain-containing protein [Promethearchaeota archaeon]